MVKEIEKEALQAYLFIGVKMKDRIEVYSDDFSPIIHNIENLSHTKKDDYQFHLSRREERMCIREFEEWCLDLSFEILLPKDKFDKLGVILASFLKTSRKIYLSVCVRSETMNRHAQHSRYR